MHNEKVRAEGDAPRLPQMSANIAKTYWGWGCMAGGQSSPGPLSNAARSGQIPYKASIFHMQFCNFAFQLSSGNPKAGDVPQSNLGFS